MRNKKDKLLEGKKERIDVDRKVIALIIFTLICALLLIGLVNLSVNTSSGIHSYISGEAYWSKAQKEAIIHLTNYIYSEDETEYESFQKVIRINLGNVNTDRELQNENADYFVALESFLEGYNSAENISHMVKAYNRFQWLPEVQDATEAWQRGDEKIRELAIFAENIYQNLQNREVTENQRIAWANDLEILDHELTEQEMKFSSSMGTLARDVNNLLRWSIISLGLILLGSGVWLTLRFLNSADKWMYSLRESEDKFRTLLQNSRDVLYKMDLSSQEYEFVSPTIKDMLGYETEEFLEGGLKWIYSNIHPEDKENMAKVIERYDHVKKDKFLPVVEFRLKDKSGAYRWVSNVRTLVRDEEGNPQAIVGSVRDISEKKKKDEQLRESLNEKEILLQEIHHRVKNNLTIVSSLLELQKDGVSEEVQDLLSASQSRIKSIAKVHEKLYKSTTLSNIPMDIYINELAEEISKAYASEHQSIDLQIDVTPFEMNINEAIPCGLILNELINNNFKHGFKGLKTGIIRISLQEKGKGMELVVENNGRKLPDDFKLSHTDSLGMTLIQVLIKRFDGKFTFENGEWTRFIIYWDKED